MSPFKSHSLERLLESPLMHPVCYLLLFCCVYFLEELTAVVGEGVHVHDCVREQAIDNREKYSERTGPDHMTKSSIFAVFRDKEVQDEGVTGDLQELLLVGASNEMQGIVLTCGSVTEDGLSFQNKRRNT